MPRHPERREKPPPRFRPGCNVILAQPLRRRGIGGVRSTPGRPGTAHVGRQLLHTIRERALRYQTPEPGYCDVEGRLIVLSLAESAKHDSYTSCLSTSVRLMDSYTRCFNNICTRTDVVGSTSVRVQMLLLQHLYDQTSYTCYPVRIHKSGFPNRICEFPIFFRSTFSANSDPGPEPFLESFLRFSDPKPDREGARTHVV